MSRSLKLGSAFGIGIYVHWTFLLLPAWIFLSSLGMGGTDLAIYAVSVLFGVFGCVVLHELGHALMARRYGIATHDITLYPIGGVARLERMSERPGEEFWIAVAGPFVNVVIIALLGLVKAAWVMVPAFGTVNELLDGRDFLTSIIFANVMLVVFNLLPAFPMDGGRVFRALLAHYLGQLRGTEIAAAVGMVLSSLIAFFGLVAGAPVMVIVGIFVFMAGQQELAAVRSRSMSREDHILDVLPAEELAAHSRSIPTNPFFSGFTWDGKARLWVEWRNGRPVQTFAVE